MFGSIAGSESMLLAFDENYQTSVAMAEAPHGTAPALRGKDLANPLAMILACGALLRHAADQQGPEAERAERAIYEAALETIASGVKTPDLGGHAGTTEFTDATLGRVQQSSRAPPLWGPPRETACSALFWRPNPAARFRPRPPVLYRTYVPVFS